MTYSFQQLAETMTNEIHFHNRIPNKDAATSNRGINISLTALLGLELQSCYTTNSTLVRDSTDWQAGEGRNHTDGKQGGGEKSEC